MPTILLIEDDMSFARELRAKLQHAGHQVVHMNNAHRGLQRFAEGGIDLVLLDMGLPDKDGGRVLETIRSRSPVPVIVLTARRMGKSKVDALDKGADDYVVKPVWSGELLARIRAVLRRGVSKAQKTVILFGDVVVLLDEHRIEVGGMDVHLTPTEMELLSLLLRRAGQALSRERLMDAVLGPDGGALEALQSHVSRLRKKLGPDGARIETIWGVGYRLRLDKTTREDS